MRPEDWYLTNMTLTGALYIFVAVRCFGITAYLFKQGIARWNKHVYANVKKCCQKIGCCGYRANRGNDGSNDGDDVQIILNASPELSF